MKPEKAKQAGTEVLFKETTMPSGVPVGVIGFVFAGLILATISFTSFIQNGMAIRPLVLMAFALLAFFLSFHLHKRYTSYFEIIAGENGKLIVRILSRIKNIVIAPAGKVEFYYSDSFEGNEDSPKRRPEFSGTNLYVVFFDENNEPVFGMTEMQVDFLWHNIKKGFEEVKTENNKMVPHFLNTIDLFSGPVTKIYKCCS